MITKITLENFFSFGSDTTIELNSGVNILVGINGSGKSNLLKAIKLLFEGIAGEGFKKTFLEDWGGFSSVANFSSETNFIKLSFEFDANKVNEITSNKGYIFEGNPIYEIKINQVGNTNYFLSEKLYSPNVNQRRLDFKYMDMSNGKGWISTRDNNNKPKLIHYPSRDAGISFGENELVLRQISDPDRYYPHFTLKKAIESIAVYDYFDTTLKSKIRQPRDWNIETKLVSNGENLTIILQQLKNKYALDYEKIEKSIKDINPYFKDIGFDFFANKIFLVLREKKLSKSVSISHISDGTLRFLILLAIFFNPERGKLISLDEPETGLHPDMISSLSEWMKNSARNSQVIIATHSPLLLNNFDLEDLLIFEKDNNNQTIVETKNEEDFEEWVDKNFSVGQLWLKGLLGGKRW